MRRFRLFHLISGLVAVPLVALFAWANWQTPSLHEFAPESQMIVVQLKGATLDSLAAHQLEQTIARAEGVTACRIVPGSGLAVVSFLPTAISESSLRTALTASGAYQLGAPKVEPLVGQPAPQCPVPASYITALNRVRFALNMRRFFVRGV
jgi:hypothetical protein